jgi:hypothetical protein
MSGWGDGELRERLDCVLADLKDAESEVARLRAALLRYGRHRRECAALIEPLDEHGVLDRDRLRPCSCGFSAALVARGEHER